jgi:hypothetical protein
MTGDGVEGAIVAAEGQTATTITAADGSFALTDVEAGFVYLYVTAPSAAYLDGETLGAIFTQAGQTVADIEVTLSGRPSADAVTVGMDACQDCHKRKMADMFAALDGSADAAAHSRFVTEGTSHLVYPELWPAPGDKFLPRNPKGELLLVQDPADGAGLVNVVLCTQDGAEGREYIFKFYAELTEGAPPWRQMISTARQMRMPSSSQSPPPSAGKATGARATLTPPMRRMIVTPTSARGNSAIWRGSRMSPTW